MSDVTLTIDGRSVTVPAGTLVIRAAEKLGIYVPRFCDHPLLEPVGACRQCIVEVEGQRKPMTSCTTTVAEGMVVKTQFTSELAADAQEGVLELLLINHPLDCPMCDKGGECPLQDQALEYGPDGSRYIDPKRRFTKPVSISPLIKLDRERCVLCARCTRFSEQIAGDPFIELFERSALEQVAIFEDEPFESEFSGNVAQICPVGALLPTTFRFRARPFDMTTTVSTCNRCASGCKTLVQERRGELVRILSGANADTQDEWICDKGRFGFAYAQTPERVTEPLIKKGDGYVPVSWAEAVSLIADRVRGARDSRGRMGVIGGAQLCDEDAYALARFARVVLGTNDVDSWFGGTTGADNAVLSQIASGAPTAGFADIDSADTIVTVGVDLREVSPIVFLRVRKNARNRGAKIVEVGGLASRLSDAGASWTSAMPGQEVAALADLNLSGSVVVLAGDSLRTDGSLARLWNLCLDKGWKFGWVPRKANARGALVAGCSPRILPGGRDLLDDSARAEIQKLWNAPPPQTTGRDGATIIKEGADTQMLFIVGADPVADAAGSLAAGASIDAAEFVVAIDLLMTETARRADVILPATSIYERAGTLTSWEGRRQPVRASVTPPGLAQDDRLIFAQIASELGHSSFPTTRAALSSELEKLVGQAPAVAQRVEVDDPDAPLDGLVLQIAPRLIDEGAMMHGASRLSATARAPRIQINPETATANGIKDADRVSVQSSQGRITGTVLVNPRIAPGVVVVPAQQSPLDGVDLASYSGRTSVKISKVDA
jgi:NADH-quinone oxidoreductase subunit G